MTTTETFNGRIGTTYEESQPDWPAPPPSHDGNAPNVVVILFDDTGFGNLGCYGSSIDTPNIDALAANGLRYSNFHVTPLCSPTRASLLTGRNHHSVGMGAIANYHDIGVPSHRALVSRNAATLAEMLREEGYSTYALGKWHLNPSEQNSAAGPRHGWPLQRGFDRYYGFLAGATDQFYPELTYDNHPVDPPKTPEEGYHVTEDLVDHAITFVSDQKAIYPDTPFFLYFAPGAMHEPHHAPKQYIDKYRGAFDDGWDVVRQQTFERQLELGIIPPNTKLHPRNPGVKPWDELTQNEKNFTTRLQETWAGFLEHTDAQIGRLVDYLDSTGQLDNTIIVLTADNGTSQNGGPTGVMYLGSTGALAAANDGRTRAEAQGRSLREEDMEAIQSRLDEVGGPRSFTDIPWGWSQAANTPLKWYKADVHGGGVRVPLIVHHPARVKDAGGIRHQFHHVSDVAPTILEMLGIEPRSNYQGYDQMPISGTSFAYTCDESDAPSKKSVQYFEMLGHRGIWADGWKAVTRHEPGDDYRDEDWELYNLAEDFSETVDLAAEQPERLRALIDLWWLEAGRYGVLPLVDRAGGQGGVSQHPGAYHQDLSYHFRPPLSHLPSPMAPQVGRGNWVLTADIEVPDSATEGVIYSQGSVIDGFSLFIQDGRLCFVHKALGDETFGHTTEAVPNGRVQLALKFERTSDGPRRATFMVAGEEAGSIDIPTSRNAGRGGVDIGRDVISPITDRYEAPFEYTAVIHSVDVEVTPR
jgi:arylsulfatase